MTSVEIVLGKRSGLVRHGTGHSPEAAQGVFGQQSQRYPTGWDCWGAWAGPGVGSPAM